MNRLRRVLFVLLFLESALAVHEYGHLREFQKRGVPIKEFSLGIGPPLCQYTTDSSLTVSFRIIPIMAFVSLTEEGANLFDKQGTVWDKIVVHTAGVRDNLLVALVVVLFLQFLGWKKGNLSSKEFARTVMITPLKIPLRFVAFLVGCVTARQVNLAGRFLLSTGGIDPPMPVRAFIFWNLMLGFLNLTPVPPLDGSRAMEVILLATGVGNYIPSVPGFVGVLLFAAYFVAADSQDLRLLEIDRNMVRSEA